MPDLGALLSSAAVARAEDRLFWPTRNVFVASVAELQQAGDIVPYTLGNTGLHLRRLEDGRIVCRVNRMQHGGCTAIPQQCQTGTKTTCPQIGCGFSRDGEGVISPGSPHYDRRVFQLLGRRPEDLPMLGISVTGGLVSINLTDAMQATSSVPTPLPVARPLESGSIVTFWHAVTANWKLVLHAMTETFRGTPVSGMEITSDYVAPNLVRATLARQQAAIVVQSLGPSQSLCRLSLFCESTSIDSGMGNTFRKHFDHAVDLAQQLQILAASSLQDSAALPVIEEAARRWPLAGILQMVEAGLRPRFAAPASRTAAYPRTPQFGVISG